MKKRNKKYNPNKLVNLYRNELAKTYELWSSFDDVELTEASNQSTQTSVNLKKHSKPGLAQTSVNLNTLIPMVHICMSLALWLI